MSTKKTARHFVDFKADAKSSTISRFVQNHTNSESLLAQIKGLYEQGLLNQAHEVIDCVIDHNKELVSDPRLFTLHARIYIEQFGFSAQAQCCIQQALLLDEQNEEATQLQTLAQLHETLRDGLYEAGEQGLRAFLINEPQNAYAQYLLANHLFWKNGPESEALSLLEKSVKTKPAFLKAWLGLAMAYKKAQNTADAETAFQRCLGLDTNPTNQEFYKKHLQSL